MGPRRQKTLGNRFRGKWPPEGGKEEEKLDGGLWLVRLLLVFLCGAHSSPQERDTDSNPSTALYQPGTCAST